MKLVLIEKKEKMGKFIGLTQILSKWHVKYLEIWKCINLWLQSKQTVSENPAK